MRIESHYSKGVKSILVLGRDSNRRKRFPQRGGGEIIDFTSFDSEGRGSVFHLFVNRPPSKNEGTDREIAKL